MSDMCAVFNVEYFVSGVLGSNRLVSIGAPLNIVLNVYFYFFHTVYCMRPFGKIFKVGDSLF